MKKSEQPNQTEKNKSPEDESFQAGRETFNYHKKSSDKVEKLEEKSKKDKEKIQSNPDATPEEKSQAGRAISAANEQASKAKEKMDKKIERHEREKLISGAIDFALEQIKNNSSEKRSGREDWVIKSVSDALGQRDADWKVLVEGQDEEQKSAYSQMEGVPVEELIKYLDKIITEKNQAIEIGRQQIRELEKTRKQQADEWLRQGDPNSDTQHQLKMSWHAVYNKLSPDDPLRQEIDDLQKEWQEMDREKLNNKNFEYNDEEFAIQTGEAFRQALLNRKARLFDKINEVDNLVDQANVLEENSKNFYDLHPEIVNDPEKLERRKKMEAKLISHDQRGQARREGKDLNNSAAMKAIMDEDYFEAEDVLKKRKEVVLPDEEPGPKDLLLIEDKEWRDKDQKQIPYDERKQIPYEEKKRITYEERKQIEWQGKKVRVVNIDEIVRSYARRIASEETRKKLNAPEEGMRSNSRTESILNNITAVIRHPFKTGQKAYLRMAESAYTAKFYVETLNQITSNQNLMLEIEASYRLGRPINVADPNLKRQMNFDLLDKVMFEYAQNVEELEEKGNKLNNPEVNTAFQDLIARHLSEGWDRPRFENEQRNLINDLKARGVITNEDFLGTGSRRNSREVESGLMYATNMYEIAEDYKTHLDKEIENLVKENDLSPEQREKIAAHVRGTLKLDIELGAKFSDLHNKRPEGTLNKMESVVRWAQRTPIIRRIASNPGSVAFMVAIGADLGVKSVLRGASKIGATAAGAATGALIPILAAAGLSGAFGYFRRSKDIKKDRAMHQDQRIMGQEFQDHRRNQMEEFQYDIKNADELQTELNTIKATPDYNALPNDQKDQLTEMYARFKVEYERDLEYRTMGGQNRTVDLISVKKEEGKEYGTNYMSKTDLKADLYNYLRANNLIPPDRTGLPEQANGALSNADFNNRVTEHFRSLSQGINQQDAAFDKHRVKSSAVMGAITAVGAGLAAIGGQELIRWWKGGNNFTALDLLRGKKPPMGASGRFNIDTFLNENKLDLGHNKINIKGEAFDIVMKTGSVIDEERSKLPPGWFLQDNALIHKIPGTGGTQEIDATKFAEWAKNTTGQNLERVTYAGEKGGFAYQGTAPEKGIRALPEIAKNFWHNLKLHSNSTELMMHYQGDSEAGVVVDASKMFGKLLKGDLNEKGVELQKLLASGQKVYLALSLGNEDGTQFTPIKIEIGPDGHGRIPAKLSKIFCRFDDQGNLIQGPGKQFGLHSLIIDSGEVRQDGAHIVKQISSVLGEAPTINELTPGKEEVFHIFETPGESGIDTVSTTGTPRWQPESAREEDKKNKPDTKEKEKISVKAKTYKINKEKDQSVRPDQRQKREKPKPAEEKIYDKETGFEDKSNHTGSSDKNNGPKGADQSASSGSSNGQENKKTTKEKTQPVGSQDKSESGNREAPNDDPEYYIKDEKKAEALWQSNKNFFGREQVELITGIKNQARLKTVFLRMEKYAETEKERGTKYMIPERNYFLGLHEKFLKANPNSRLSFPEFNHCLRKGMAEAINGKPRARRASRDTINMGG